MTDGVVVQLDRPLGGQEDAQRAQCTSGRKALKHLHEVKVGGDCQGASSNRRHDGSQQLTVSELLVCCQAKWSAKPNDPGRESAATTCMPRVFVGTCFAMCVALPSIPQMRYSGGSLAAPFHLRRAARSLVTASICRVRRGQCNFGAGSTDAACHPAWHGCSLRVGLPAHSTMQRAHFHPSKLQALSSTNLRVRLYLVHVQGWVAGDCANLSGGGASHEGARGHLSKHSGPRRYLRVVVLCGSGVQWHGRLAGQDSSIRALVAADAAAVAAGTAWQAAAKSSRGGKCSLPAPQQPLSHLRAAPDADVAQDARRSTDQHVVADLRVSVSILLARACT